MSSYLIGVVGRCPTPRKGARLPCTPYNRRDRTFFKQATPPLPNGANTAFLTEANNGAKRPKGVSLQSLIGTSPLFDVRERLDRNEKRPHLLKRCDLFVCPGAESNHRHVDFQSTALPTELPGRLAVFSEVVMCIHRRPKSVKDKFIETTSNNMIPTKISLL